LKEGDQLREKQSARMFPSARSQILNFAGA
jgi:hypothetical protein